MLAFYDFPAEHWIHVRTSNPIEFTFATVRHRTERTKGCVSRASLPGLVFKLAMSAEHGWGRLRGFKRLGELIAGVKFVDDVLNNKIKRAQVQPPAGRRMINSPYIGFDDSSHFGKDSSDIAMRKLIINAEDFGLAPSVNQAVIDCFRKGNLTSATLMANMPAAAHAAKLVKDNPGLAVGLHFCITEWRPLSRCPSLINKDGFFYTRTQLLIRILTGRVNAGDIQGELEAQINRAESLGIKLTRIDSHQHIHMIPWVFNRIAPIVCARGLPMRLVYPPIDAGIALKRPLKFFKQLALYHNSRRYRHQLKTKSNDCLVSIHDLGSTEGLDSSIYMALLKSARGRDTIEIMVHPYILGDDIAALYGKSLDQRMPFLKKCALEYRLLSGRSLFSDQQKFQLVNYAGV